MSDMSPDCLPVRYFCTAGNGMETFVVDEVKRKVEAQDVIKLQGKVIFSSPANIKSIINLKSAERLFLLLNYDTALKLPSTSTKDVSKVLGARLSTLLSWKVDLKNPHIEVNVNLTDDYCLQGIPLTKFPLANRNYIQTTGLRSTIAWAMASVAQIQAGSFVVDPMCGVGTILIEAAKEHSDVYFLGIDIDDEQLIKANRNVAYAHLEDKIQVIKASSLVLPLHSESVDAVVCDLPFGRKFGTKVDAAINLPLILSEMTRVLRVGGILVLLLSPQLSCQIKRLLTQEKSNSVV
ncbi:hypothetical protein WMY93_018885 [Mugilogobius chulae]|uniref:Ribosomal RNA large subunit methyltransferase K/L-like methyltransferase domain-containing protein n=1 Tax=Mugilogobius chulae TaxID=88201 RepID=A0AAW0NWX3_9GOBI